MKVEYILEKEIETNSAAMSLYKKLQGYDGDDCYNDVLQIAKETSNLDNPTYYALIECEDTSCGSISIDKFIYKYKYSNDLKKYLLTLEDFYSNKHIFSI